MEKIFVEVVDKDYDNAEQLKTILSKKSYFEIHHCTKAEEIHPSSNLIFFIDPIANNQNYASYLEKNIPLLIAHDFSKELALPKKTGHIKEIRFPFKKIEILSSLYDILGARMKEIENKYSLQETYYQVSPKLLLNKSELAPFNLYLKVSNKHIKIMNQDAKNFDQAVTIYIQKGANSFYITQKDFVDHRDFIIGAPKKNLKLSKEEQLLNINEFFHGIVEEVGVNKSAIKMADNLSTEIAENLSKDKKNGLLSKFDFLNTDSDFIYNHSYITSLIASQITKKMEWDTRSVGKKLVTACLFHDLAITDPKVALIEHLEPNIIKDQDLKTRGQIETHHLVMANILKDHIEIDGDTIQIIKDSHIDYENKNKINQLRPLSYAFHLSHFFVVEFFKVNMDHNQIPKIVEKVNKTLESKKHENILTAFKSIF